MSLSNKVKKKNQKPNNLKMETLFLGKLHPLKDKLILFIVFLSPERDSYSK